MAAGRSTYVEDVRGRVEERVLRQWQRGREKWEECRVVVGDVVDLECSHC